MATWLKSWAKKLECGDEIDKSLSYHYRFTNKDLKPVEEGRRLWRHLSFVTFWIADAFNIGTFLIAAASIDNRLSWWQAWLCVWLGYTIVGLLVYLNGRPGAIYHIGFPVYNRASFGIWGSLWPVFNRGAVGCIWYGVQAWIGGQCVYLMICSVFPSFGQRPTLTKTLALGTTVNYLISFILFWLGSLPFIWLPVQQTRHLFTVKAIVAPAGAIGLLVWTVSRAGSLGPVFQPQSTAHGWDLAWIMISAIMSCLGNFADLIVNNADGTRFANTPHAAMWPQLLSIPLAFGFTSFIGVMIASASAVIFPESGPIWNPLDVMNRFLTNPETGKPANSSDRAGVFFIATSFMIAQLGVNIAWNSISVGMDFAALVPRYVNIRRGGYICAVVGIAICPWQFVTSDTKFTDYVQAYSVFLSSIVGPMVADFYLIRKGCLDIQQLYNTKEAGIYFGTYGFQWRGFAAYVCGICINVVGFVGLTGVNVPKASTYIYRFNYLGGFLVSAVVYYILARIFVIPGIRTEGWWERGDAVEQFEGLQVNGVEPEQQEMPKKPESGVLGTSPRRMSVQNETAQPTDTMCTTDTADTADTADTVDTISPVEAPSDNR